MNILQQCINASVTEAAIIYFALKQSRVSTVFSALSGKLLDQLDQVNTQLYYLFMSKLVT